MTTKALFRRDRLAKAVERTKPRVIFPWRDRLHTWATADTEFAAALEIPISSHAVVRNGRVVAEPRVLIPECMTTTGEGSKRRLRALLEPSLDAAGMISAREPASQPDDAIETLVDEDRIAYLESFRVRLLQSMVLLTLEPLTNGMWLPGCHAYVSDRSIYTAVRMALQNVRAGRHWVIKADIQKFFESPTAETVDLVIRHELPQVTGRLRDLILWFLYPNIIRDVKREAVMLLDAVAPERAGTRRAPAA